MFRAFNRQDILAALLLLLLPLLLFWPVTLGPYTLLPVDNLFAYEPWLSYRAEVGLGLPQNQLLSDLILENYVWKKFIREAIAAGQLPLWNPYILSGQPFLANGQHSVLYPFSLLFYILPLPRAYGWFTVSQLWLAGLSMYIFLRTLRATRLGALAAGMIYSLSAFFIVSVVFTMIIAGAVWLPLLLALIELIIRKQEEKGPVSYSPIPFVVAGAAVLGLQTLAGHVEITYYTLLVGGFYAFCRLISLWRRQATPRFALSLGGWLLLMAGLGLSLGLVQLGPMYEVVSQNFRQNSVSLEQVRGWALPLRRIATFFIPDFFGSPAHHAYFDVVTRQWQPLGLNFHGQVNPLCPNCAGWDTKTSVEAGAYLGLLPLILAALAILQAIHDQWPIVSHRWSVIRHRSNTNLPISPSPYLPISQPSPQDLLGNLPTFQPSNIFTLLSLLSLLFAFGSPLYAILFYGLPGWDQLHSPFRWIFPYTLSIAVLAGLGITYLDALVSARSVEQRSKDRGWRIEDRGWRIEDRRWAAEELPTPQSVQSPISNLHPPSSILHPPSSILYTFSLYLGWVLFWGGFIGVIGMLAALVMPAPFITAATLVFERSGLAQNAFADGRQFFGYQWPNFFKFFLMLMASGALLRIVRCPIYFRFWILDFGLSNQDGVAAWKPLAVIIIALDLFLAGAGFNPAVDPALLDFKPEVVKWLEARQAEDPFFRLNSFDTPGGRGNKLFLANAAMFSNLFDVRGYDSIIPAQYGRFMHLIQENGDLLFNRIGPLYDDGYAALSSALLDLLGVRYILTTVEIHNPGYQLVYDNEIRVYENVDALPRAFMVYDQINIPASQEAAGEQETRFFGKNGFLKIDLPASQETGSAAWSEPFRLALRSLNPAQQVILDGENNGRGHDLTPAEAGELGQMAEFSPARPGQAETAALSSQVEIIHYTPNEIYLAAQVDRPGWLVLSDAYFPGWRAYASPITQTDQSKIPNLIIQRSRTKSEIELTIHRADGAFRAVYLQPGGWQLRFRYAPRSFQLGLYGSFLSLAVLTFIAGYWAWGKLYRESESDSPIKRIAKNSLVPMVMALSNRLVDLVFALLMLRILQPEGAGRYAFAVAFIGLVEILTRFGLGTLATREVAGKPAEGNRYLANVSILRFYLWLAALPVMAVILALYVRFGDTGFDVVMTIGLFAAGTFFSNLADGLTAIFYAYEKAEYPAAVTAITTFTRVSVGALVLLLGWGIIGLAGASLAANLVAFIVLSYLLVAKIFRPRFENDPSLQKEMLGQSFPLMINHLLSTIFFRIDVFILKPTWGNSAVGFYSAAYKYIDGINVIPQYFTLAIFPRMSRFAAGSRESLIRAYILSLRLLLLLALPIAAGTPFVTEELILFLAGEQFIPDSVIVLQLLIWFLPFSFINQVTQYVLIAIHQQRQLTRAFIIGVLFNTIANLIFIPLYGYRAAAITTILSEWSLLIPFYFLVRKELSPIPWFDIAWRPTLAAAVMGLCLWLIGEMNFLVTFGVGGAVYLAALALLGGLTQPDMGILWRAVPVRRLKTR